MTLNQTLATIGISALGVKMPRLAPRWTTSGMPTPTSDGLALTLSAGEWVCPVPAMVERVTTASMSVTLVDATGAPVSAPGLLLTIFPETRLRLRRLYGQLLESTPPENGRSSRPVPAHLWIAGTPPDGPELGNHAAGDDLGVSGRLSIHDQDGFPIDPLAVASAFVAVLGAHDLLASSAFDASSSPIVDLATSAGTPSSVRVRLTGHDGRPIRSALAGHLTGLTVVDASSGLYSLDATAGGGSDLTGTVGKATGTDAAGAFPDDERRLIKLGLGTLGRMSESVTFPALPAGRTLARDYFSLRVVELRPYLLGAPNPAFDGTKVEQRPTVRIHERLDLLADGNDVLAASTAALTTGSPVESMAVGQSIDGAFRTPDSPGAGAHWPAFPGATVAAPETGPLPPSLRASFAATAAFFDDGDPARADTDIVVGLSGLPPDSAVRVYPRRFTGDATEERGDGAGGVVPSSGTVSLLLRDPLGLRRPGLDESAIVIPAEATLHLDVMVVRRSGEARLYGNVTIPAEGDTMPIGTTTDSPAASGTNPYGSATCRGVSNAGILGLAAQAVTPSGDALSAAIDLAGEGDPRDASRLPTMARRELMAVGLQANSGGSWRSVLAGGRLAAETHSAGSRLGAPGGDGGRETQVVGVASNGGRLAYDIARMAARRTMDIATRLVQLADDRWEEPPQPSELPAGTDPTATAGTFAGAALQTISPTCESPELSIFRPLIDPDSTSRPTSFDALVDFVKGQLGSAVSAVPASTPRRADVIEKLNDLVDRLDELKDNTAFDESQKERLFNELERELMSAGWGRRDAQWALAGAIRGARRFIYIESPGFAATQKDYGSDPTPPYAADLVELLGTRLTTAPGLRVVMCTPKHPDHAAGYGSFAAQEVADRKKKTLELPTASDFDRDRNRVVGFHPIGFPGRPSRLESTVVIVDDVWAMVGASAFRRRGLTFDGAADVVFTDTDIDDGVAPRIREFRRGLMADRLGVPGPETTPFPAIPDARWIRLGDLDDAAGVVRDALIAGGLGKIEPLWKGETPGVPAPVAADEALANPEGLEFPIADALATAILASLDAF